MREPPPGITADQVLAAVRAHWDVALTGLEHLPVGFGAYHWAAYDDTARRVFVTYDRLAPKRTAASLEAAYAGAAALRDAGLEFVLAPIPTVGGTLTTPFAEGSLSCTPWLDGSSGGDLDVSWTSEALRRLHAADPPAGLPRWQPLVGTDFAERTAALTEVAWGPGPYAEPALAAVRSRLDELARWTDRYHHLAGVARERTWVATHGEPHPANQLLTARGRRLVDWESLKLAPAELDLRILVDEGAETAADPEMLELFDLEWRLDEIDQYSAWFAAPHSGTADDEIAFGGLVEELDRP